MRSNKALTQAEQILANLSRLPQQKAQQQAWQELAILSRAIQAGFPLPLQDENILPLWENLRICPQISLLIRQSRLYAYASIAQISL